jgi:hypothetical protein
MNLAKKTKITERRESPDFWFYLSQVLTLLSWTLFVFALVISFYAAPEKSYGVIRYHNIEIRQFWLTPLTGYWWKNIGVEGTAIIQIIICTFYSLSILFGYL